MRDYSKVSTTIWRSRKFRNLPDDQARMLYLYLLTCPHCNMVGCFVLPPGYVEGDTGWPKKAFRKALESLLEADLIAYDETEQIVRIKNFLRHDPFTNPNQGKGAVRVAKSLPDCHEKLQLFIELSRCRFTEDDDRIPAVMESLSKGFSNPIETRSRNRNRNRSKEPEPEPEQSPSLRSGDLSASRTDVREATERIFDHWKTIHEHPKAVLDQKRRRLIRTRLIDYTEADLCQAISGYRNSSHHMGTDPKGNGTVYDSIELLLRDSKHVDMGLRFYNQPAPTPQSQLTRGNVTRTEDWVPPELRRGNS